MHNIHLLNIISRVKPKGKSCILNCEGIYKQATHIDGIRLLPHIDYYFECDKCCMVVEENRT